MNIEHLKYFATVAELGSINKAAHELYISQPHLGNIIKDLEEEFGTELLLRTSHGVTLTPEGRDFLEHAQKILSEYQDFFRKTAAARSAETSLEVSMTRFSHIMESFIDVVLRHSGDAEFSHQLNEGSPDDVIEDIASGISRIGVLNFDTRRREYFANKLSAKHLEYHPLAQTNPCILVSNDHPLLKAGKPVTLESLEDYVFVRYIGQDEDYMNHIESEQGIQNLNASKRIIYSYGRSTLLHLIGRSDFYGIGIYDFTSQERAYNVRSIPIEGCRDTLEFGYIYPAGTELSPITREFVDELVGKFIGRK